MWTPEELKNKINDAGITQTQLARGCGYNDHYISDMLCGRAPVAMQAQGRMQETFLMLSEPEPAPATNDRPMDIDITIRKTFEPERKIVPFRKIVVDEKYVREHKPSTEHEMREHHKQIQINRVYRRRGKHRLIPMPIVLDAGDGLYRLIYGRTSLVTNNDAGNLEVWSYKCKGEDLKYLRADK